MLQQPTGAKYLFAQRHGVHTVRAEWVTECVQRGERVEEALFAVGPVVETDRRRRERAAVGEQQQKERRPDGHKDTAGSDRRADREAAAKHTEAKPTGFLVGTGAVIYVGESLSARDREQVCAEVCLYPRHSPSPPSRFSLSL